MDDKYICKAWVYAFLLRLEFLALILFLAGLAAPGTGFALHGNSNSTKHRVAYWRGDRMISPHAPMGTGNGNARDLLG